MKSKYAKDFLHAFKNIFFRKITPENFCADKETEYGGTFFKILQIERH